MFTLPPRRTWSTSRTFKSGVLEVHVPKLEQATPRTIDIKA